MKKNILIIELFAEIIEDSAICMRKFNFKTGYQIARAASPASLQRTASTPLCDSLTIVNNIIRLHRLVNLFTSSTCRLLYVG